LPKNKNRLKLGIAKRDGVALSGFQRSIMLPALFSTALKVIEKCEAVVNRNRVQAGS
jgi:hypothetical protein